MRTVHKFIMAAVLLVASIAGIAPSLASENTLALVSLGGGGHAAGSANRSRKLSIDGAGQQAANLRSYSIDYIGGEKGTALNFTIKLNGPGLSSARRGGADFGNCVVGLPATHQGQCRYHAESGELKVVVFSMSNAVLSTGSIGTIVLPAGVEASLKPDSVTLSDRNGKRVDLEVL